MNILKRLFKRWHKRWYRVDRSKTTKEFQSFKKYYAVENKKEGKYESDGSFLVRYILQTKLSPFIGDNDLEEARKVLIENRITAKVI